MKINVLGVKRIHGTSGKTGNQYDMCNVLCVVPIEQADSKNMKLEGHGFDCVELALDPKAIPLFAGLKFPSVLDLETDSRSFMGKLETFVVGINGQSAVSPVKAA